MRFFARIRRADLECPRCGTCYVIGDGATGRAGSRNNQKRRRTCKWDPKLQRFKCRVCGLTLVLGLVAYRAPQGGGRNIFPPEDSVPTIKQALSLRRTLADGVLVDEKRRSGQPVNITEDELPALLADEDDD